MPSAINLSPTPRTEHASCVAIGEAGVLIRGPSGAGKSSLALKLILDAPRALPLAELVSDDRVLLKVEAGRLLASAPPQLAGLIEVRGLGIRRLPHRESVALTHVVDLTGTASNPGGIVGRMPEPEVLKALLEGHSLRRIVAGGASQGALLLAALLVSDHYEN